GLTLSPGVRYELQSHVNEAGTIAPRFAVTWAPFKSGKTTLRSSAGVFYDWLDTGTYEQTLRVNGTRQQEVDISNPSYPDPGTIAAGAIVPANRYLLNDDWRMLKSSRLLLAGEQSVLPALRLGISYTYMHREHVGRGLNLNAPVDGVRPNPLFGNIIEAV